MPGIKRGGVKKILAPSLLRGGAAALPEPKRPKSEVRMVAQVMNLFFNEWSRSDTIRLLLHTAPLLLPILIWYAIPGLRKKPGRLLVLFGVFVGLDQLYFSCLMIFQAQETAFLYQWSASKFMVMLGLLHAAAGAGIFLCLVLKRLEWINGILATLGIYSALSAIFHLIEVFKGRITLIHLGPPLWHDVLLALLVFWVLSKEEDRAADFFFIPR